MKGRLIGALPILIGVLALGNAAQAWPLAGVLVVVIAGLLLTGPRLELDSGRQMLTSAIGAGTGYVLCSLLSEAEPGRLSEGWTRLAAAAFLAAAARLLIVEPRGGYLTSFALMFFGLVASGETRDPYYAIFATSFLLASSWAFTWKPERVLHKARTRRLWVGALLWALALGIGVGGTLGLRQLHAWVSRRDVHRFHERTAEVGFAETMDLGSLDGLLDSSKRVWRLRGPRVDYLRGTVFDRYEYGHWFRSQSAESSTTLALNGSLPADGVVEISAVSARTRRFFLPLEARRLVTSPTSVRVDALGSIETDPGSGPLSASFSLGARERAAVAAPGPTDRQVPRRLKVRLPELAAEWTRGALSDLDKLSLIERRLRTEYEYARAFDRPSGVDPIADFLFEQKRGHCEYFATALALVARAAGIPTRVVMGYRVAERSPFGYYVVRERNAHAWVEAWLPDQGPAGGGWSTRDATPETELPQNQAHDGGYANSLLDGLTVSYDDATRWLGNRTLVQTSVAWLIGALILSLIVARQARRKRPKPGVVPADERLLPYMQELLDALGAAGHSRRPDEPLERFAARLPEAVPAQLLERYAALRYGGQGDPERLASDVSACARSRERASRDESPAARD